MEKAKVVGGYIKQQFTDIMFDWECPYCKNLNNLILREEEDLNYSQDNYDNCFNYDNNVVITASEIYESK